MEDTAFHDYMAKFCLMPVYGQKLFIKTNGSFAGEPKFQKELKKFGILYWIYEHRFPFFLKSALYLEYQVQLRLNSLVYKLTQLLILLRQHPLGSNLIKPEIAVELAPVQAEVFTKMSGMSKFYCFMKARWLL